MPRRKAREMVKKGNCSSALVFPPNTTNHGLL